MTAIEDILTERRRQDAMWGQQDHGLYKWAAILTEEFLEFIRAVQDADGEVGEDNLAALKDARAEAIQLSAVAVAIIESMDRANGTREER